MRTRSTMVLLLFGLSGIAGLGYQVAWTRMFSVGLGHEMPGLLAVVTAFFVGLAIGGAALDRRISRSAVPGRWYAGLEFVIGAWAIIIALAAPWLNDLAATLIGAEPTPLRQWLVAFGLPVIALLPATAAMGGTLPAVERLAGRLAGRGTTLAGLYAANTLGAMVGIVASATIIVPLLGLRATVFLLAALNVLCGLAMWLGPAAHERERPAVDHAFDDPPSWRRLSALLLGTGMLGLGYEVAGVRVVGQVLENTVYTYASTVATYLLGTAIGAALWQRFGPTERFRGPAALLLGGLAVAVAAGALAMGATQSIYDGVRRTLGEALGGAAAAIAAEATVAAAVFGPATLIMGATFSHLVLAARRPGGGVGLAMAINTLGAALAPPLVGVMLVPQIGARWTLTAIAAGYVVLLPLALMGRAAAVGGATPTTTAPPRRPATAPEPAPAPTSAAARRRARGRAVAGTVPPTSGPPERGGRMLGLRRGHLVLPAIAAMLLVLPLDLQLVSPPAGMQFVPGAIREGVMGTVAVAEDARGDRVLKVNNQFNMGGTRYSFGDRRQGHLPMLLHPAPRSALFLGVGSGLTAGAATLHGDVEVTAVELVPEIVELLPRFSPANRMSELDRVVTADARRFVRADRGGWDVIVADLFHPARDGAGGLYTREHFAAVRARLNDGGVFCQWLPLYQLDAPVVALIVRTFLEVFPDASGWIGTYNPDTPILGLVGRVGSPPPGLPWSLGGIDPAASAIAPDQSDETVTAAAAARDDAAWLEGLVARRGAGLRQELRELALTRPIDILACRIAGPADLRALAGVGPLNLDDHPRVAAMAPWYTYAAAESGLQRIEELLALPDRTRITPDDALDGVPPGQAARIAAFIAARDGFLRSRIAAARGDLEGSWAALLESMNASPEFRTAAVVGISEAEQLARGGLPLPDGRLRPPDPARARVFLDRIIDVRPQLADARRLRAALDRR